jgi:hypothetical protein
VNHQYLQIVYSVHQGEKVRQQVFGTLGRLDELKASGRLEALIRSGPFISPCCIGFLPVAAIEPLNVIGSRYRYNEKS